MSIDPQEKAIRQEIREFKNPPIFTSDVSTPHYLNFGELVEWENGVPRLSKKHQMQLERELLEMDEASQYVLIADKEEVFPCQRCPSKSIFLRAGEVWRYGVTRKGQKGRYSDEYLNENNLIFLVQTRGNLQQCLKQEKIRIFNYPLLPENIARSPKERLAKPPGNLRTD